jgi:hypothetical protein
MFRLSTVAAVSAAAAGLMSLLAACEQPEKKETRKSGPGRAEPEEKADGEKRSEQPVVVPTPTVSFRPMTEPMAKRLVRLSLKCVGREYPNKPCDVQTSDRDVVPPRELHPAFFGCFDWHSAVHGHWTMVRILKTFPKMDEASKIREALNHRLSEKKLRAEASYFRSESHETFERPYGWGWLLRLAAEIRTFDDPDAKRWAKSLAPLEEILIRRTKQYLEKLSLPVRAGTHHNTAFALAHIHDYSEASGNQALAEVVERAARRFYETDRDCPTAYEPSGEDFISPCLAEADLMRRVMPPDELGRWLTEFLPPFSAEEFRTMVRPPEVLDPKDPKIGHLIGLMFHRAWTYKGIADSLTARDPRSPMLSKLALLHEHEGLRLMFASGYGGAHWLASFAVFSLTDANRAHPAPGDPTAR